MQELTGSFYVDYRSATAIIAMVFFAISVPFRIFGYKEHFSKIFYVVTQVVLPAFCALLMIGVTITFGERCFWLSVFPLTLGILSFVFKLFIDPRYTGTLHHIACGILYSAIVVLWFLTVRGTISTPWILAGIFGITILIHIFGEDLPVILRKAPPLSKAMWLKEASMVSLMLALIFLTISFQKM